MRCIKKEYDDLATTLFTLGINWITAYVPLGRTVNMQILINLGVGLLEELINKNIYRSEWVLWLE